MERCDQCKRKQHDQCEGIDPKTTVMCECPCHSGEVRDPLSKFLDNLGVVTPDGIVDYKDLG